ncbi:hypothetical protein CFN78_11555 [Amycolatopsis antarctica]|uniref:DUF202 domain-containing protein n=1 Tax=Amycolatopsis antarctica TaxID=1854586 RepID=A0A263D3E7_9PSEU|nr:DUF202 domain-containing protein [Amycolatopsis antarctica]OZM72891.1 hypothetical protein CFN78_11555 [Amycolatopsis antarctica]
MGKLRDAVLGTGLYDEGEDPDYRFSLANERTFLAWIRTSLALLAGGVAVLQLVPDLGPRWARVALGAGLIVLAVLLAAMSHRRWRRNERAMRLKVSLPPTAQIPLLAYGLGLAAIGALVAVLLVGSPKP